MLSNLNPVRHLESNSVRGKIIEYSRKRPKMPGIIESPDFSRTPDLRTQEVRAYLARLLASRHFAATGRRGQLLGYLVERTLAGDADKINEYAIGLEVFQRPPSFDPRIESVVRTEVSRLRQRLKDYYADEGARDLIVFDLPQRSYVVNFEFREATEVAEQAGVPQLVPVQAVRARSNARTLMVTIAGMLVLAAAGFFVGRHHFFPAPIKQHIDAIVVLPFENYSSGHDDDYVADGMTEELTNDLAQWRDLRVVARTSAFAFKGRHEDVRQIGQELNVDAVLEGSFTRQGDQVRVTAQLNRASDGYHLWSHSYETSSKELLNMQAEVANSIASAIGQFRGGGAPPAVHPLTTNSKSHDLYLQGVYQLNLQTPQSYLKSIQFLRQAIEADPSFARAYLELAKAEGNAATMSVLTNQEAMPDVRRSREKAIALDPNLGDAFGTLAFFHYTWDWDWPKAEVEFRRALELGAGPDTRGRYGWALATRGRFAEAHEQFRQASELDPLSVALPFNEFFAYNFERDVVGQQRIIDRMYQIQPNFLGAHLVAASMAGELRECGKTRKEADFLTRNYPKMPVTQSTLAIAA